MRTITLFILTFFVLSGCSDSANKDGKINLIFDTDIGPDYDDVGAITMVHALADSGKVNILGTIASSKYPAVAQVIDVFNTYFKRPDLVIGVPKGDAVTDQDFQHWSDTIIARYPHSVRSNEEVPDAVEAYRKILVSQPDQSVTVVTVGFLTNLANLLNSQPDNLSDKTGKELVKQKVKLLVSMAGRFPSGREYNVWREAASARKVISEWPTPIIFSGFEIGEKIKTGLPLVANDKIANSPVKDVFRISIPMAEEDKEGRKSWDQTAVLVAINGASPYFDLVSGTIVIHEDGSNTWNTNGNHAYLVQKISKDRLTEIINSMMMHQP